MTLLHQTLEQFKDALEGRLILPKDPHYEEARQVWNAMIDRRPAAIVQCAGSPDVSTAIHFARKNGLEISVRGAGHNITGNSLADDGLVIDFAAMKSVQVDPGKRRARVQAGATLAGFDAATQKHGLATPLGINSTTGISGLTLGGGFGWLTRKYGMTVDNLLSAEVVDVDGQKLHADEKENADLFWALRGGGGNFGVVTEFEFKLHPVGPEVFAGIIVYPFDEARQVLRQYRDFAESVPEDLTVWAIMRQAPPLPFLPAEVHGEDVVVLAVFYCGDPAGGDQAIEPLRHFGSPIGEHVGRQPYVQWQQAFDPLLTPGARNYWKTHNFQELPDGLLEVVREFAAKQPSPHCEIFFGCISGAANRVPAEASAYPHRDVKFVMNVHGRWDDRRQDDAGIAWARNVFAASEPYASAGAYVNFMTEDEGDRVSVAYGVNYARLGKIKQKYDPDNILHMNQNIKPSPPPGSSA
jgi:FAD/FMN-containing dehydrogenase